MVAGFGCYSYFNLKRIKFDKERKNVKKMGSIPCRVQFHAYLLIRVGRVRMEIQSYNPNNFDMGIVIICRLRRKQL